MARRTIRNRHNFFFWVAALIVYGSAYHFTHRQLKCEKTLRERVTIESKKSLVFRFAKKISHSPKMALQCIRRSRSRECDDVLPY